MASGIVTGCGKGIGLATAARLLRGGDSVIGISRSKTPGILGLLRRFEGRFHFFECDICNSEILDDCLTQAIAILPFVDYAVGNAGMRSRVSMSEASMDRFSQVLNVNTLPQIQMAKFLIDNAIERSRPLNLLFLTSIVGPRGFSGLSTYACSKSALEGFVRSAAVEYARRKILINCLAPGFVKSSYHRDFTKSQPELHEWTLSRTPLGRWGTCHEVAHLIAFLVSKQNSYMTGTTVYCDGGWTSA
jgi:NAD(P)-dependent dehydrogenase (short-subunit alcohol dehydrogenase family)